MPDASIIICTYNRVSYLKNLLESITYQRFPVDDFEVLIIDNNSTDTTAEVSARFIDDNPELFCKYIKESQAGLSFARNRGIEESEGEVLIFVDDDARLSETYLDSVVSFFKGNADAIAGGGKILPDYESIEPQWMTPYLLPVVSALNLGDSTRTFPGNKYPIGANMFFRRDVFEKFGNFNTRLGRKGSGLLGGEEKDMFERLETDMKIIYIPEAQVWHYVPDSRLEFDYIKGIALGVGKSEYIRVKQSGKGLFLVYLREIFKWGASIILYLNYLMRFTPEKGKMLILFRYYVSKGILESRNDN